MSSRKNFLYLGGGGDQRVTPVTEDPAFEFDESDLWNSSTTTNAAVSQPDHQLTTKKSSILPSSKWGSRKPVKIREPKLTGTSLPVNVPDWSKILRDEYKNGRRENDDDEINGGFEDDDRLPPHEYLARTRIASFSVHEGIGRTLKGRDLSRVRNAIWKQTGFED